MFKREKKTEINPYKQTGCDLYHFTPRKLFWDETMSNFMEDLYFAKVLYQDL